MTFSPSTTCPKQPSSTEVGEGQSFSMIKLIRSKPSSNLHRFYAMHLAPTLFRECALVIEWGRAGSPGTIREQLFQTEETAQAALRKRVRIKTRRGYICAGYSNLPEKTP
jgi:predicted DNA-binding WGR domain protein